MARAAVRYVATRPMRFGKSLIADVLHGGNTERIRQMHLDEDRGYGELSSESVGRIKDIIGQLCGRGYLATSQGQYPVVGLGPRAGEVEDEAFAFTVKRRASKRKASAVLAVRWICCARRPSWISARAWATMPSCSSACAPCARRSRPSSRWRRTWSFPTRPCAACAACARRRATS